MSSRCGAHALRTGIIEIVGTGVPVQRENTHLGGDPMKARLWFVSILVVVCLTAAAGGAWAADRPATPAVYPIQEQFVDANGVLIYTLSIGRGAPLVVLHGGPGASHDYFLPYLLPLARHNRLVFIAERGSGRSEKLEDASHYTVEAMVEDVEAVRVALGLGKISLLGHSYGGVLAEAYALKYQQNLAHLVLASTFPSTKEMNEVFVKQKQKMPAQVRENIDKLEAQGLFGHGKSWERNRYTVDYMNAAWGLSLIHISEPTRPY